MVRVVRRVLLVVLAILGLVAASTGCSKTMPGTNTLGLNHLGHL
jgi:hypothetical protein